MRRAARFAGVLGWPLQHTLSPIIHNAAFKYLSMNWRYLSFPVPPEDLRDAVVGLKALGAAGANVTMPHKRSVIEYLDELDPIAVSLGAVNTIENRAGVLIGHNTDVVGFTEFLTQDAGMDLRDRTAVVMGAGGAARAVVRTLVDLGAQRVTVVCRDGSAGEEVAALFHGIDVAGWERGDELAGDADLIVNCTPVGMSGEELLGAAELRAGQTVVDLIYDPPRTPLLEHARSQGCDAWGGLGMLVHQAAGAFRIWTGQEPPLEIMSAAAVHALGSGLGGGTGAERD